MLGYSDNRDMTSARLRLEALSSPSVMTISLVSLINGNPNGIVNGRPAPCKDARHDTAVLAVQLNAVSA